MKQETILIWWWLNVLNKKRYDALLQVYGSLDDALAHLSPELLQKLGMKEETVHKVFARLEEFDPAVYLAALSKKNVAFLTIEDEAYPPILTQIDDPPLFLSYRGDLSLLSEPMISLVGTRGMSPYGKRVVELLVPDIVRAGLVTVSGLALGIDAEVARATLHAGGRTIAVLGHGLGTIYPKNNERLGEEIVAKGGLLLSEFPLEMPPDKFTFPARNRIIAGLGRATVIVEAPDDSGSIITAELALEYNRDVYAVPGQIFDPNFAGCHRLIAEGRAKLVTRSADILQEMGVVVSEGEKSRYVTKNPEEEAVLKALTSLPQSMDDLKEKTKMDASTIGAALTMMELAGAVKNVGGGMWVRR